jgi:aspartate/methionine/tyrosine aminotransferase
MTSSTKERILQHHHGNLFLVGSALPLMSRGDLDFAADEIMTAIDERMIASAAEALEAGQTHYVDVPGIGPLRGAIAEYVRHAFNASYAQPNVIVTAGMQESRFLTLQMIGDKLESVAIPAVVHPGVKQALGVRKLPVQQMVVDARMLPTLDGIREALQEGNRLLYLESPSRLTGAVYDAAEVAQIAAMATQFNAVVVWDQGLAPWSTGAVSLASIADAADRTVVIGEGFPGMGMASWFIGYIAAPEAWVPPMTSQKQIMAICTATATQYAALEASKFYAESQPLLRQRLKAARDAVLNVLGDSVIDGSTASVVAVQLSPEAKANALARLQAAGYDAADGAAFGAPDVLRLTISLHTALQAAAQLVKGA